jgi:hypothetical protein
MKDSHVASLGFFPDTIWKKYFFIKSPIKSICNLRLSEYHTHQLLYWLGITAVHSALLGELPLC